MSNDTPIDPTIPAPSAEGIVAVAGKDPLPHWLDTNGNGLADVQEPAWLLNAASFIVEQVLKFVPSNTATYRYADYYRQNVLPILQQNLRLP